MKVLSVWVPAAIISLVMVWAFCAAIFIITTPTTTPTDIIPLEPIPVETIPDKPTPIPETPEPPSTKQATNTVYHDLGIEMNTPPNWPHQPLSKFDEMVIGKMLAMAEDVRFYHTWSFIEPESAERIVPTYVSLEVIQPPALHEHVLDFISSEADIRIQSEGVGRMGGLPADTTEYVILDRSGVIPITKLIETRVILYDTMFVVSYGAEIDQYQLHLHHYHTVVDSFVPPDSLLPEMSTLLDD